MKAARERVNRVELSSSSILGRDSAGVDGTREQIYDRRDQCSTAAAMAPLLPPDPDVRNTERCDKVRLTSLAVGEVTISADPLVECVAAVKCLQDSHMRYGRLLVDGDA